VEKKRGRKFSNLLLASRLAFYHEEFVTVRCCERLCAISILLEHPDLPSVDTFVGTERLDAHINLQAARQLAGVSAALANTANYWFCSCKALFA